MTSTRSASSASSRGSMRVRLAPESPGLRSRSARGNARAKPGGRAAIAEGSDRDARVPKMTTSSARSASSTDAVKLMGKEASHASAVVGAGTVEGDAAATTETGRG